ncbi:hypothetical protein NDU88_000033 [Pleurodeles waltl]|uniref:Uncharacterized protein n=1 Tax=Pleurodeles waltl TaxID=8319 RepID=A0AAV7S417_PLEWA|nr:hypothetical protein NDU88_000033 [Pleurodeles waltl]
METAASVLPDPLCGRAMSFKGALWSRPVTMETAASVLPDPLCGRMMSFKVALWARLRNNGNCCKRPARPAVRARDEF